MTVAEAIAEIRKTGTIRAENGKLKLRFSEPERARLAPAIEALRRDLEAVLQALMRAETDSTRSRCTCAQNSGAGCAEIQHMPELSDKTAGELARGGAVRAKVGFTNQVESTFRWYCSTCGRGSVIWHLPEQTCDAHERAIIRAHGQRQPGCRRLDYRVVSDSETWPRGGAAA